MKLARALFVLSLPVFWRASAVQADFETPLLIQNAKIVPSPGQTIERGWILIKEGRIHKVDSGDPSSPPTDGTSTPVSVLFPNAETFDASGLIVYPGFIDSNTHSGMNRPEPSEEEQTRVEDENPDARQGPQSATVQAYRRLMHPRWRVAEMFDPASGGESPRGRGMGGGAGTERGAGREATPPTPEERDVRAEHRAAGFTLALVSPKPAIFSGVSAILALGDAPVRRSIVVSDFAQHAAFVTGIERGADFAAVFDRPRYPTTTMGAMAAFRQIMLDSAGHRDLLNWSHRHTDQRRAPVDRDLESLWSILFKDSVPHGTGPDPRLPVVFMANSENEIHRALDMAAEFSLKPIIAGAREGWKVADRLKREGVPVIVSLKWSDDPEEKSKNQNVKKSKRKGDSVATSAPTSQPEKETQKVKKLFDEEWESQLWEPAKLFEEKKRLWGEEADNAKKLHEAGVKFAIASFEMKSPGDIQKNIQKAIERGLPEDVAVAALTHDAAGIFGLAETAGDIAQGRYANLTLMTKPLADKDAKVQWVFVEGKRFRIDEKEGGGFGRGKGRKEGEKEEPGAAEETERTGKWGKRSESQPTSQTTSMPTSQPEAKRPEFACEIEADRKPGVQTGGNLLLKNATVLTVNGADLAETDLLIKDGKIAEIGKDLTAPSGVITVDLRGYFISPGVIDPHSHICSDGGLNEFSLSVTCEVRVRDVLNHRDESAYRALAGGVTCVHTMHGSANTIGGQNAVLRLKYSRPAAEWLFKEAPQTVKFALGENVKQSNSDRRGRGTRFPNTRAGVEGVLRRSFDAAVKYKADCEAFERDKQAGKDPRPVRRDLRLDALAAIHDGAIWVHCHCYRADEILRLLAVAEEFGFRIGVLQHVLEGYRIIPEIRRHGCGASTFSDWWAYKIEAFDAIPFNAARMEQGGVVATVNSDSAEVVRHLNLEAAKSMRFGGLPPGEALKLCTLNGAIQLGVDKYIGSIEAGKFADLAVWDAHPLDTYSKCVLTIIDGEVYFRNRDFDPRKPGSAKSAHSFISPEAPRALAALPGEDFWLVGGTIYPVSGPSIANGALHIKQGKIEYVGSRQDDSAFKGSTVMDVSGLRVYPGLIDVGTQLGLEEIGSVQGTIDVSEIADFQPDLQAVWAYNPLSELIEVGRCEGITSAMVLQSGGVVSSRAGVVRLNGWSMPEALVASPLALRVELPSLPIEFPEEMQEERKMEAKRAHRKRLDEIEEFFDRAKQYAKASQVSREHPELAPEADARLHAMIPYMDGQSPVLMVANSYKQIREALEFAKKYNLRPIIFGGRESWKLADELARSKVDVIFARPTSYPGGGGIFGGGGKFEPWDSVYTCPAALKRAGVRFCISVPNPDLTKQLGVEAGLAVAHGLDEETALQAITLDAARIVKVDDRLGSLDTGKSADIIVTTNSPMQASNSVVAEFIAGKPIELTSRHTRADEKWRRRPEPDLRPEPTLRGRPAIRVGR